MGFVDQFIAKLEEVTQPRDAQATLRRGIAADSGLAPMAPGQLLQPAALWNWPDTAIGTISDAQFYFADTVPQSAVSSALYEASSRSFSAGYRVFLSSIDTLRFNSKYPQLLEAARLKAEPPKGDPASVPTPPGWTKLTGAGISEWKPLWSLQPSATAWTNSVATGEIDNPGTIRLRLAGASPGLGPDGAGLQIQHPGGHSLSTPPFETVEIKARCWGRVAIYPGAWFDAAMLKLGKPYVNAAADFFGPDGLLACRVSTFYVALEPEFSYSCPTPVTPQVREALASATTVRAFGVEVHPADGPVEATTIKLVTGVQVPVIVAAVLDVFPP